MSDLAPAAVRVPCSTSNLGGGYDVLGVALDRCLNARFEPGDGPLRLERSGTLASIDGGVQDDIVARAFTDALAPSGIVPAGTLHLDSNIPIARGLGSSAAATLAGFDLARSARGLERDDDAAFRFAFRREGHGDNAAPCLWGGLRAVLLGGDGPTVIGLELSPAIGFAYAAPAAGISTREARDALPLQVGHGTAARSLSRAVALVRGLATGDPELLRIGGEDELHVPHRLPMIPGAYNAIGAGYDAGAWLVTVSGAGSGLIALCEPALAEGVAAAMREVFSTGAEDSGSVGFAAAVDHGGMTRSL